MTLFRDLKRQLHDLQQPRTLHNLHNIAGRAAHELVLEGFRTARDPSGMPWAPTKRKNPILVKSKALRDNIKWKADSRAVVIRTTGKANRYAAYHQQGTRDRTQAVFSKGQRKGQFRSNRSAAKLKRGAATRFIPGLPARKFMPDPGRMPLNWEARFENDFRAYFRQRYGGR